MKAKKLREILNTVHPDTEIFIAREGMAMGSSETGMYATGPDLHPIKSAKFFSADELGASCGEEKVDRIEILEVED